MRLVCIGKRRTTLGAICPFWLTIHEDDTLTEGESPRGMKVKRLTPYVGQIYEAEHHSDGSWSGFTYAGRYEGPEVSEWRAAERSAETLQAADRLAKKERSTELDEAIELLRGEYHRRTIHAERAALLASYIEGITR